MKRPLLLVALFVPLVHGCGCESGATSAMKKKPAKRLAGAWVDAPAGARWRKAVVEVVITSRTQIASGRQLPIEMTTWSVGAVLLLEGGAASVRIPLAGGLGNSWDEAGLVRAADASWKIAWAPDDRGVACLEEGGDGWLWVCCDGSRPFHCPHMRVAKPGDVDPCAKGPRWRDLALELMSLPDPKSAHPEGPDANEWNEIAMIVGTAPLDPVLADALVSAAIREKSGFVLGPHSPDLSALQIRLAENNNDLGWSDADAATLRAPVRKALEVKDRAGSIASSNAAILLSRSKDEVDQQAMARAMLAVDWAPPAAVVRDLQWPRAVAWSLARSVEARSSAFGVEESMIEFLKRKESKPESDVAILFALAMHGSPKAREFLEVMAKDNEDPSPAAWPASLDELWQVGVVEHGALTHNLAAWAKAALTAKK